MTAKRIELWISAASVAATVIASTWGFTTGLRVSIAVLETRTAGIEQTQREMRDELRQLRTHQVAKPFPLSAQSKIVNRKSQIPVLRPPDP